MDPLTTCPSCDSHAIQKVRRNWIGHVKKQQYVVPHLEYYACPQCGEHVYDREAMRKIESYSPAFASRQRAKKSAQF